MKKIFTFLFGAFCAVFVIPCQSFGQATATSASVTWVVTNDSGNPVVTPTPTGNLSGTSRGLNNLNSVYETGGGAAYGNLGSFERLRNGTTLPTYDATTYLQYSVSPTNGKYLQINSISLNALAGGTSNVRLALAYSTDGTNYSAFPVNVNYGATGSAGTQADPVVVLRNDGTPAESDVTLTYDGKLSINIEPTGTFYLRIYPFLTSAGSTKSVYVRNVMISGKTKDTTLPLDFLSFTAKPDAFGKTVALNWSTTNEVNTKNFEIQRRTDGTDFVTIGKLDSKNVAGIHNYSYTDNSAVSGNSYYRIIQFDNDGASTSSKILAVTNKATASLSIYPNPTTGTLNVSHSAAGTGAIARVVNMDGKTVLQQALSLNATDTKINVSQLTSGSYLLILDNRDQKSSLKFIKQ